MTDMQPLQFGQAATFYPPGSIVQNAHGVWYAHRNGRWEQMTAEEVTTHLQSEKT